LHTPDATCVWTAFLSVLWDIIDEFVPHRNTRIDTRTQGAARHKQYPQHIHKLMVKRRHLWKELHNGKDDLNRRLKYRDCTNELRQEMRLLVIQRETNII